MKSLFISQSNYIPWKGYFDAINSADEFIVYDSVQYTKNDWRNRNKIKTNQGTQWLTIPVEQVNLSQKIDETRVSPRHQNWREKHWKTLCLNYAAAPYFKMYSEHFEKLYLQSDEDNLSRINISFIKAINEILGIKTVIRSSSEFKLADGRNDRLIDLCKQTGATIYISGPAAKSYLNVGLFNNSGIEVRWLDYSGYTEYRQLFGAFVHEVTILDLIFNEGPDAKKFMKSFSGKNMF